MTVHPTCPANRTISAILFRIIRIISGKSILPGRELLPAGHPWRKKKKASAAVTSRSFLAKRVEDTQCAGDDSVKEPEFPVSLGHLVIGSAALWELVSMRIGGPARWLAEPHRPYRKFSRRTARGVDRRGGKSVARERTRCWAAV